MLPCRPSKTSSAFFSVVCTFHIVYNQLVELNALVVFSCLILSGEHEQKPTIAQPDNWLFVARSLAFIEGFLHKLGVEYDFDLLLKGTAIRRRYPE